MKTGISEKIIWDDKLSIGSISIDNDHKRLLNIYNEMYDYYHSGINKKGEFARLLSEMTDYCLTHFRREEQYMTNLSYPNLDIHKKFHSDYVYKVTMYNVSLMGKNPPDPNEILCFLSKWWVSHILKEDTEYEKYKAKIKSDVKY